MTNGRIIEKSNEIHMELLSKPYIMSNELFDKFGMSAAVNDLFLVTGGKNNICTPYRRKDEYSLKNRTGCYCLDGLYTNDEVCSHLSVNEFGNFEGIDVLDKSVGIRVFLKMDDELFSEVTKNKTKGYNGVDEIEFGEYIQYAAAHKISEALEDEYLNNVENISEGKMCPYFEREVYNGKILIPTFKNYTLFYDNKDYICPEYYYGKNKYVRLKVKCDENGVILSNGNKVYNGDYVWLKVSPIKWLVDYENKKLVSKYVMLSGLNIEFAPYYLENYIKKDMLLNFMDKYKMIRMIHERFCKLSIEDQIDFMKYIPRGFDNIMDLSLNEIKDLLDNISMYEYGYSKKLNKHYF